MKRAALLLLSACHTVPEAVQLGASGGGTRAPTVPPSWTVPAWFVDGSNATGCASDNNNCTQGTCGGSFTGPCLSMAEIYARWGTHQPVIGQVTTITALSNFPTTDLVDLSIKVQSPLFNQVPLQFNCALNATSQAWTGTLNVVTAKNRSTRQLLESTFTTAGAPATGQLLLNSTHPSRAWIWKLDSGTTFFLSQPVTGCNTPVCTPTEVDTWAHGDAITAYTPFNVYPTEALPACNGNAYPSDQALSVWIRGCNFVSPSPAGNDQTSFVANQYVMITDNFSTRTQQDTVMSGNTGGPTGPHMVNYFLNSIYRGIGAYVYGGIIGTGGKFATMQGGSFDGDTIMADLLYMSGSNTQSDEGAYNFRSFYLGGEADIVGGFASVLGPIWGPSGFRAMAGAFVQYPTGASGFTNTFLNRLGLDVYPIRLNGNLHACSESDNGGLGATATIYCNIEMTPTSMDACPASNTAFCGHAFALGGGQFSNVFQ